MGAQQKICSLPHGGLVECTQEGRNKMTFKNIGFVGTPETINVGFSTGTEPRVKTRVGFEERKRSDILRQDGTKAAKQFIRA